MEDNCEIFVENVTKTFGDQEVLKPYALNLKWGKYMEL